MRVAIIGGLAKKANFTPKPNTEIWGMNAIRFAWVPRWDRMFNLHIYQRLKDYNWPVENDATWMLANPKVPFYTLDPWPIVDGVFGDGALASTFPKKSRQLSFDKKFSGPRIFPRGALAKMPRGNYHCGSFDWLIAFAIYLGAKEIDVHGVGLCLEAGEPISARACLEYWCGYAEGRGIKVTTMKDCDVFHFYHLVKSDLVYGYDDTPIYEDRTKGAKKGAPYTFDERGRK